jgi:hypothetical protein
MMSISQTPVPRSATAAAAEIRRGGRPAEDPAEDIAPAFVRGQTPSAIRKTTARAWSAMT